MIGVVAAAVIIVPQVLNTARTSDMRNNVTNQPTTATQQADGSATMTATPCPDDPPLLPDDVAAPRFPRMRPPYGSVWRSSRGVDRRPPGTRLWTH